MKRSITRTALLASAALLGACAVVPADPYGGAYPANVPGSGYGGYETVHGGYAPAYGTQDPYYGGYNPGYVYPGYPVPQVGVGVIVPAPVIVRPAPIVITPARPRHDPRDNNRRLDDRRGGDPRVNDPRRDDRRQHDGRASIDRTHPAIVPVVPAQPPAGRPPAHVPRQEAFVPRDERGEADAAPRQRGQPSEPRGRDPRARGADADRP